MHQHISTDWQESKAEIFWAEIAPSDHVVQIYENDESFLNALAAFIGGGINAGDAVVVVATDNHLTALENVFSSLGVNLHALKAANRYIALSAEKTLEKFMVNGWPDEDLFNKTVKEVIAKANKGNNRLRVFGEMVAMLWGKGLNGATVQLEHLWNKFCETEDFCLFCAYPKAGFTGSPEDSVRNICCTHSKVINGEAASMTHVLYQSAV